MTSHATVSAEKSEILSQITRHDIGELTHIMNEIEHAQGLVRVMSSLGYSHTDGPTQSHLLSVARAVDEKLNAVVATIRAWPSAGHVTIAE
jgi:vinculin binding protein